MSASHLILAPFILVLAFGAGFVIAQQTRALQAIFVSNSPVNQPKWLISVLMGAFFGGLYTFFLALDVGLSTQTILAFLVMWVAASGPVYVAFTLGWQRPLPASFPVIPASNTTAQPAALPEHIVVEDGSNMVKITITTPKRWVWFVMSMVQWLVMGLCILPVLGIAVVGMLQNLQPEILRPLIGVLAAGLLLYLLYVKFKEALEYVFDREMIAIDNQAVTIERSGSVFQSKRTYPAENIRRITPSPFMAGLPGLSFRRSPFGSTTQPGLMIWYERGRTRLHMFGRGVELAHAQSLVETICRRFPQYRGS